MPLAAIVWYDLRHHPGTPVWRVRWQLDPAALATLLRLGVPAMLQMVFEVGVFALASSMAASQTPTAIAAHQVSLELAGLAYMVPLGIASAAAVRVGHAVGRRDGPGAEHAGWAAILMGTTAMATTALLFVLLPRLLIGVFSRDPDVIRTGTWLLGVGAVFAVFDGVQVIATGALRGLGETRRPMIWNLVGHWGIGLPIGWTLAFVAGWGVLGHLDRPLDRPHRGRDRVDTGVGARRPGLETALWRLNRTTRTSPSPASCRWPTSWPAAGPSRPG